MVRVVKIAILSVLFVAPLSGCQYLFAIRPNCDPPPITDLKEIAATDTARMFIEPGVFDAFWLEVDMPANDGVVGGYLVKAAAEGSSLVILLDGASTFKAGAGRESSLTFLRDFAFEFLNVGMCVWSLDLAENEPYGTRDADQLTAAIDWLDSGGRDFLDVENVYIVGYSTGATTANVLNTRREVTAIVSMAGLAQPNQVIEFAELYRNVTALFPCNTAMDQMRITVDACMAGECDALDVVRRVADIRNDTLFLHTDDDFIYQSANSRALQAAYADHIKALQANATDADGTELPLLRPIPKLDFRILPSGGHFFYVDDPQVRDVIVEYLMQYEPNGETEAE